MKSKVCRGVVSCLVSVVVLSLLVACTAPTKETAPSPIEITDQLGRTVKLERIPERIISLAPSNTEILFALGLADRVVAVSDYSDYPPEAKAKPSIGGLPINIEEVVALYPDLILAAEINEESIPQLEARGLTVFALNPKTLDEVLESITLVGKITGKDKEASQLVAQLQKRIKAVTNKTDNLAESQRPRVFYIVWHDPLFTTGSGTFQNDLIKKAGGTNIFRDLTGWPTVSLEALIAANPEVMIAGVGEVNAEEALFQFIKTESRLRNTAARQNNRVYEIDADSVSRPGPRIVDALEQFAVFIHPELFKEK